MSDKHWSGWDIFLIVIAICIAYFVFIKGVNFDRFTNAGAKIADKVRVK